MFKKFLSILLIFSLFNSSNISSAEETISSWTYQYLMRINKYMEMERWEDAERELIDLEAKYFTNERTYERALINQLYGQFYLLQGDFISAIPWLEKAVKHSKLSLPADVQTRTNLATAYFQLGEFQKVISTLLKAQEVGLKKGIDLSAANFVMLGMAYYQKENFEMAYKYVSQGNSVSTNFNEDWLQYEFALAVKLQKYDEAVDIGQYLVFINPNKDNYWKQLSGVYYGSLDEERSLAGLELAFEKNALSKEKDFENLAKYFLYKNLPIKAIKVIEYGFENLYLEEDKDNYNLLADSYFLAKDRVNGIKALKKSLKLEPDPNTSYKIARFAFESEDWKTAIEYFQNALDNKWDENPGRIELLMGIAYFELEAYDKALSALNISKEFKNSKSAAEGWISYINELNS